MGTCRETKNILFYVKRKQYKRAWKLTKKMDKTTYEDTVMPFVCKVKGHKAYQPEPELDPNDWACTRCHKFIKHNPRKEKLKKIKKMNG